MSNPKLWNLLFILCVLLLVSPVTTSYCPQVYALHCHVQNFESLDGSVVTFTKLESIDVSVIVNYIYSLANLFHPCESLAKAFNPFQFTRILFVFKHIENIFFYVCHKLTFSMLMQDVYYRSMAFSFPILRSNAFVPLSLKLIWSTANRSMSCISVVYYESLKIKSDVWLNSFKIIFWPFLMHTSLMSNIIHEGTYIQHLKVIYVLWKQEKRQSTAKQNAELIEKIFSNNS